MRLEDVFLQHQPVQDGQYGIDSIDNEQHDPKHVLGLYYKRKDHEHNGKGDGHSTDVAGEASGRLPEIEEAEDYKTHHQNRDEIHIDEVELMIDNGQTPQNHQRISAGNAVYAVHEIVCIDDVCTYDPGNQHCRPLAQRQNAELMEHQQHGDEMYNYSESVRNRRNVICERYCGNHGQTCHKPHVLESEASRIDPHRKEEDDAAATQGDGLMRTTQIRLVDDVQSVRNPEIKQLQTKQQECNNDILYHNHDILKLSSTGLGVHFSSI